MLFPVSQLFFFVASRQAVRQLWLLHCETAFDFGHVGAKLLKGALGLELRIPYSSHAMVIFLQHILLYWH